MKRPFSNFVQVTNASTATRVCSRATLALLFVLCRPHFAAAEHSAGISVSRGLGFAVADFDGDHQPDVATVQTGTTGTSSGGNYFVRFRFSALGRRYIRVTAPKGGLLVEARDVNGDNAVDLVVASAWLNKPVAILLNDGNGNFSQVDPARYPDSVQIPRGGWNTSRYQYSLVFGLPRKSSAGDISLATSAETLDTKPEPPSLPRTQLVLSQFLTLRAPRAPPLAIRL